jgi:hypothetical protein
LSQYPEELFKYLKEDVKAQFALDMLYQQVSLLKPPKYIAAGLDWLQTALEKKLLDTILEDAVVLQEAEAASTNSLEVKNTAVAGLVKDNLQTNNGSKA